jgi:HD-GYP domain-containing protein (c-di-GMP phosphodiesterase class II)
MNTSMSPDCSNESQYRIAQLEERFQQQSLAMATSLVSLIDLRDRYTGGHSQRVAKYVRSIAVEMGLGDEQTETIVFAASLHDIGKIGVPDHVLLATRKLTDEEFGWIRKHPEWGWMAVRNVDGFQEAALLILHHHERLDGQGYPGELAGSEIPLGSRIIAVADSYDALTTTRPYRVGRTSEEAIAELMRCRDVQFDAQVVKAFCSSLERSSVRQKRLARSA